jgi:hypothetical protein
MVCHFIVRVLSSQICAASRFSGYQQGKTSFPAVRVKIIDGTVLKLEDVFFARALLKSDVVNSVSRNS